jgi:UDP-3-O-[3-hydroxymyristoyl] glucosamine N-acyltransferase
MITPTPHTTSSPIQLQNSTLIGIPSARAIRAEVLPGVRIGSDPLIGRSCFIYGNVFIGNHFRCGDRVLIRDSASIGDGVSIGNACCIDTGVSIASGTAIGENIWIPRHTTIGEQAIVETGVTFHREPFVHGRAERGSCRNTLLGDRSCVGANAVVHHGVSIGEGSRIAPGTVVNRDVPPGVFVSGCPAAFRKLED